MHLLMTFFVVNPGFPRTLRSAKKQSATALLCKAVVTEPIHHFLSDSVRPQRRQPTRLPRPWDSPGKNTGVGCHNIIYIYVVKSVIILIISNALNLYEILLSVLSTLDTDS